MTTTESISLFLQGPWRGPDTSHVLFRGGHMDGSHMQLRDHPTEVAVYPPYDLSDVGDTYCPPPTANYRRQKCACNFSDGRMVEWYEYWLEGEPFDGPALSWPIEGPQQELARTQSTLVWPLPEYDREAARPRGFLEPAVQATLPQCEDDMLAAWRNIADAYRTDRRLRATPPDTYGDGTPICLDVLEQIFERTGCAPTRWPTSDRITPDAVRYTPPADHSHPNDDMEAWLAEVADMLTEETQ